MHPQFVASSHAPSYQIAQIIPAPIMTWVESGVTQTAQWILNALADSVTKSFCHLTGQSTSTSVVLCELAALTTLASLEDSIDARLCSANAPLWQTLSRVHATVEDQDPVSYELRDGEWAHRVKSGKNEGWHQLARRRQLGMAWDAGSTARKRTEVGSRRSSFRLVTSKMHEVQDGEKTHGSEVG